MMDYVLLYPKREELVDYTFEALPIVSLATRELKVFDNETIQIGYSAGQNERSYPISINAAGLRTATLSIDVHSDFPFTRFKFQIGNVEVARVDWLQGEACSWKHVDADISAIVRTGTVSYRASLEKMIYKQMGIANLTITAILTLTWEGEPPEEPEKGEEEKPWWEILSENVKLIVAGGVIIAGIVLVSKVLPERKRRMRIV